MKRKYWFLLSGAALTLLVIISLYHVWNIADPAYTCARCHEVAPSHASWLSSAHREVACTKCHGTALSGGTRTLKEKAGMVFSHFKGHLRSDDIGMTEAQTLEIANRCASCHQAEYAGWLASGHAVNYREIFMDARHNAAEKPYWDCFRCHGMYYEGNIHTLMDLNGEPSEWKIIDKKQEALPTVPCLACHQMHTENPVSSRYISMADSVRVRAERHPKTALYLRADKMHLRSDYLTKVQMTDGEREVAASSDPNTLLCMQCHAPNVTHRAGSQDDRTPVGVHEGISCTACHQPHSTDTRFSCDQCHPAMSNCGLDVKTMNTTFKDPKSPNDIHRIDCTTCHTDNRTRKLSPHL